MRVSWLRRSKPLMKFEAILLIVLMIASGLPVIPAFGASAPSVVSTVPADHAGGVLATRPVVINFDVNIVQDVNYGNITIEDPSLNPITITKTISNSALTLTPTKSLAGAVTYTVTIPAGAIKDASNNSITADITFDFTVQGNTAAIAASKVAMTNNPAPTSDTIAVSTLNTTTFPNGTIIRAYGQASGGSELGRATVNIGAATITLAQLGIDAGTVYLTATAPGQFESSRTAISYNSEGYSATGPSISDVTIINNPAGVNDTIVVASQGAGNIIRVYTAATGGTPWTGIADINGTANIVVPQLSTAAGTVYISRAVANGLGAGVESPRRAVPYLAESSSMTPAPAASTISIVNNVGIADTITVTGNVLGDILNVYSASTGGGLIGTATADINGTAIVSVPQLGSASGTVYVTNTTAGLAESARVAKNYSAEAVATAPITSNITIVNNTLSPDVIRVINLTSGDTVKVYKAATGGNTWGTATASAQGVATLSVAQLGTASGSVYISRTAAIGTLESTRTTMAYAAESSTASGGLLSGDVVVNNVYGGSNSIVVNGLYNGDVVKVYSTAAGTTILGTATAAGGTGSVTITPSTLTTTGGSVYLTVTRSEKTVESTPRLAVSYTTYATTAPAATIITPINCTGAGNDLVRFSSTNNGDVFRIYTAANGGIVLNGAGGTTSTGGLFEVDNLSFPSAIGGSLFVTLQTSNKAESARTAVTYGSEQSAAPAVTDITVLNQHTAAGDTITVKKVGVGDVVNVYSAATGGASLYNTTATGISATISGIDLSTATGGTIYVSVTRANQNESTRTTVTYTTDASPSLVVSNVSTVNNYGADDSVTVKNLTTGDVARIYSAATGGTPLNGAGGTTETVGDMTISGLDLGAAASNIYLTVQKLNLNESTRLTVPVASESAAALTASNVTVVNNAGANDTVSISNLTNNDIVRVYQHNTDTIPLNGIGGTVVLGTTATIGLLDLGPTAGKIYVTVQKPNKAESSMTTVAFTAEQTSTAPTAASISVLNNGVASTVTVSSLAVGDVVKVYDAATAGNLLNAGGTAVTTGTSVTVTGLSLTSSGGKIYVSVTKTNKNESLLTAAAYGSLPPAPSDITVVNNLVLPDTVTVDNLASGDVVNVYSAATGGTPLNGAGGTTSTGASLTISFAQLGTAAGNIWVTVTRSSGTESVRVQKTYTASATSAPAATDIIINNTSGAGSDTVVVSNLTNGAIVNVYNGTAYLVPQSKAAGVLLGSAAASGGTATVSISGGLATAGGSVQVTVTNPGMGESAKTAVSYGADNDSVIAGTMNITITNNPAGIYDMVTVGSLNPGDIVNIYSAATSGTVLGSATAVGGAGSATAAVDIFQLGTAAGKVYVTLTQGGQGESLRQATAYAAEVVPAGPSLANLTVVNNSSEMPDTVTITGLSVGDRVRVYNQASNGTLIGSAVATGASATVLINQLGASAGTAYVSVQAAGQNESLRTAAPYTAEQLSPAPFAISVDNNPGESTDMIHVCELQPNDRVRLYSSSTGSTILAEWFVQNGQTQVDIPIFRLTSSGGTVYAAMKRPGLSESPIVATSYLPEAATPAPQASSIVVTNNPVGTYDTVQLSGGPAGAIMRIYGDATSTTCLGGTIVAGDGSAAVSVYQLAATAGTVYVTLQANNQNESTRVGHWYPGE